MGRACRLLVIFTLTAGWESASAGLLCPAGSPCFDDLENYVADEVNRGLKHKPVVQKCYNGLGCFSTSTGELGFLETLPASPEEIRASFIFHSDALPKGLSLSYNDSISTIRSGLRAIDGEKPNWLTFIVHGFASSSKASWIIELKDAVLKDLGGFVVIVDWDRGSAFPNFIKASANTQVVGRMAARLTHRLKIIYPHVISSSRIHWIGHSLGAQMSHFYSEYFQKLGNDRPARITGLDVPAPELEKHGVFLTKEDADFVEGVHTSAGGSVINGDFGMTKPLGHVDFYPNGGSRQPGCRPFSFGCSHSRAHEFYLEARRNTTCRFRSYSCAGGREQYLEGKCVKIRENWSELSLRADKLPGRGMQFFETNANSPYCVPQNTLTKRNF